jgi:hypothetical protein
MFPRSRYVLFPLLNVISSDGIRQVTFYLLQLYRRGDLPEEHF